MEEIFSKNLLFLIPFYIFSHEKKFKVYNEDGEQLAELQAEYRYIKNQLEVLVMRKIISEYTKCTLVDMLNKVLEHIAVKYENVREGVKAVMVGRVLEYEAKTIKREGIREGKLETLLSLVFDNLLSVKDASLRANLTEDEFRRKLEEFSKQD